MKLNRIKYHLAAALMAVASFFCLSIPASAGIWGGLAGGATGDGGFRLTSTPYGYIQTDPMAWRVDLYVSGNADGKINKDKDVIGNSYLPLVGSVLCVSPTYGTEWNHLNQYTYIQTNYTNEDRGNFRSGYVTSSSGEDIGVTKYTLPTLQKFNPLYDTYYSYTPNGTAQTVAIAKDLDLFKGQYSLSTNFSEIRTKLTGDDGLYTAKLIKQLTDINFRGFVSEINKSVDANIKKSIAESNGGTIDVPAFEKYLLPDSPDCMVEWAMVITPLFRFECKVPFYCYDATGKEAQFGSPSSNVNAALDAFWFAQYNQTTKALSNTGKHFPGNYTNRKGELCAIAQPYQGMLAFWLQNSAGKPANAAYCLKDKDPYLGVYTNVTNNTTLNSWWTLLKTMPSEYAKRGGISVFTTKIEAPTPKIYYHLYTYELDEQNPPAGYTVGNSYAPKDLLQFTKNLGTPMVTSFSRDYAPADSEYYYIPASDPKATENNNVPVINEFPICLECKFIEYQSDEYGCGVIGKVVNVTADERVMENGKINISLVNAIAFDPYTQGYYKVTERVGEAFKDGLKLKK